MLDPLRSVVTKIPAIAKVQLTALIWDFCNFQCISGAHFLRTPGRNYTRSDLASPDQELLEVGSNLHDLSPIMVRQQDPALRKAERISGVIRRENDPILYTWPTLRSIKAVPLDNRPCNAHSFDRTHAENRVRADDTSSKPANEPSGGGPELQSHTPGSAAGRTS